MGAGGGRFYRWVERFLGHANVTTPAGPYSSRLPSPGSAAGQVGKLGIGESFPPNLDSLDSGA